MAKLPKPKLDKGRRNYRIQKVYRGIGWIRAETYTSDFDTYRRMRAALDELYTMHDKWPLLRQLQERKITLPELYELFKTQALHRVKTASDRQRLDPHIYEWLKEEPGLAGKTKQGYQSQLKVLLRGHPDATVMELPKLLAAYRKSCTASNKEQTKARSFNLTRSAVLSYLRRAFDDQKHTAAAVREIAPFPKKWRKRAPRHLTTKEVLEIMTKVSPKYQEVVWSVYTCGFRIAEYLGAWEPNDDGCSLTIYGSKTEGSVRRVPMPYAPIRHHIHTRSFAQIMHRATEGQVQPYDLRRSFSRLLQSEAIGIPLWRVVAYMGHGQGVGDDFAMTLHYQTGDVTPEDLKGDCERIRAYLEKERSDYRPPSKKHFRSPAMNADLEKRRQARNAK